MTRSFDEIQVFDSIAERTGVQVERAGIRGRVGVCRSVTELSAKSRRLGDGFYYLATTAWPSGVVAVDLSRAWQPLS